MFQFPSLLAVAKQRHGRFCTTTHATGKSSKEMVTWMIPKRIPQERLSSCNVIDGENFNEARETLFILYIVRFSHQILLCEKAFRILL